MINIHIYNIYNVYNIYIYIYLCIIHPGGNTDFFGFFVWQGEASVVRLRLIAHKKGGDLYSIDILMS